MSRRDFDCINDGQGEAISPSATESSESSMSVDQERFDCTVSPYPTIAPPLSPCRPGPSILMDGHFERPLTEKQVHCTGKEFSKGGRSRVTIDVLPDVALLRIFDFYVDQAPIEAWHTLVHVCLTWRNVVFGSPRRLNLRLDCEISTPVREMLDIWPLLPIHLVIDGLETRGIDNIIAALEHNDRICELAIFDLSSSERENLWATLQQPFPALTDLQFVFFTETPLPVVPTSFLGGSAPGLQSIYMEHIPFPGLPTLLLSATHLVDLNLLQIPHAGYFSPEAMVTCLSVLNRLEKLTVEFASHRSFPGLETRRPPPQARTLLPTLTMLSFKGVAEYLQDLVAAIDAPLLVNLGIIFFRVLKFHNAPQLTQFINRTPKFKSHGDARVEFFDWDVTIVLPQTFDGVINLGISYWPDSNYQLSSVVQLCDTSLLPALIPAVEYLYIIQSDCSTRISGWPENSQWLELFHPFTAVKALYIALEFTSCIAPTLQELVGERVAEVLPALQTLFLEESLQSGPVQEAIEQFVAARQLSGHHIAVSRWERENGRVIA